MNAPESSETRPVADDEIDLRELFLALWQKRLIIILATIVTTAIAVVYALRAPKVYESTVLLIPTETSQTSSLGAAAALLGKKGSGGTGDLDLYQGLMTSRTVLHKLLLSPVRDWSDSGHGRTVPLFRAMRVDTSKPGALDGVVKGLAKAIEVAPQGTGDGGILEVKVSAGQPWLAQQMANAVVDLGQDEIRRVRTERSDIILSHLEDASAGAKLEWEAMSRHLAGYQDANRSISLPGQQMDVSRMNTELQVRQQKYLLARNAVEQQRLEREKAVPPTVVLDPADYPYHKSKPKRALIVALGMLVGLMGSSVGILAWKAFVIPAEPAENDSKTAA